MEKGKRARRRFRLPRRLAAPITAAGLAALLVLTGTLAYFNSYQTQANLFSGMPNDGARLHDDFKGDGTNIFAPSGERVNQKDVYVENYGNSSLLVRVRLKEYFEMTSNSGTGNAVKIGEDRADTDTWVTRLHVGENAASRYVTVLQGGSKYFLPTDNILTYNTDPNKNDPGTAKFDKADNIITRTSYGDDNGGGGTETYTTVRPFTAAEAGTRFSANVHENTDPATEQGQPLIGHGVKLSRGAVVISMGEWITGGYETGRYSAPGVPILAAPKMAGDFWVADSDGWYYWASPLLAGEATGLLVSGVDFSNATENYYYGLYAEMQATPVLGVSDFFVDTKGGGATDAGYAILGYAAGYNFGVIPASGYIGYQFADNKGKLWAVLDVNPAIDTALILAVNIFASSTNFGATSAYGAVAATTEDYACYTNGEYGVKGHEPGGTVYASYGTDVTSKIVKSWVPQATSGAEVRIRGLSASMFPLSAYDVDGTIGREKRMGGVGTGALVYTDRKLIFNNGVAANIWDGAGPNIDYSKYTGTTLRGEGQIMFDPQKEQSTGSKLITGLDRTPAAGAGGDASWVHGAPYFGRDAAGMLGIVDVKMNGAEPANEIVIYAPKVGYVGAYDNGAQTDSAQNWYTRSGAFTGNGMIRVGYDGCTSVMSAIGGTSNGGIRPACFVKLK